MVTRRRELQKREISVLDGLHVRTFLMDTECWFTIQRACGVTGPISCEWRTLSES